MGGHKNVKMKGERKAASWMVENGEAPDRKMARDMIRSGLHVHPYQHRRTNYRKKPVNPSGSLRKKLGLVKIYGFGRGYNQKPQRPKARYKRHKRK